MKGRNVSRAIIAYGISAWLLLQVTEILVPALQWSETIPLTLRFLLVIGFLPVVIGAWLLEPPPTKPRLTNQPRRSHPDARYHSAKLDRFIVVIFGIAITFLIIDRLILQDIIRPDPTGALIATTQPGSAVDAPHDQAALPASQNSVAVLPFISMSRGPDDDYFTAGLTEEIINALTQVPKLMVTARTSAFHFSGQTISVSDASLQLGVRHILEGSVQRAGDQLRITAQLTRAADGFRLWSESYDRRTKDTFAIRTDIAEKSAAAMGVVLTDSLKKRMHGVGVRNVEALVPFQKGRELSQRAHASGNPISTLRQANAHYGNALSADPSLADAYIRHSELFVQTLLTFANGQLDGNLSPRDIRNAPAALNSDLENAIRNSKTRSSRLSTEVDSAILKGTWHGLPSQSIYALQAGNCSRNSWAYLTSAPFGFAELQAFSYQRLTACDPLAQEPRTHLAFARLWLGQLQSVIELAENFVGDGNQQALTSAYILALTAGGFVDKARTVINRELPDEARQLIASAILAAQTGDYSEAGKLLEDYLGKYGPDDYHALLVEAARGNRAEANRLAGQIDNRSFGHMALMQAIYQCACGAPFDLQVTPKFALTMSESELSWPPPSPINFPLKDW